MYWEDKDNKIIKEIPFNINQVGNIHECQDNIFTILNTLEEEVIFFQIQGQIKKI